MHLNAIGAKRRVTGSGWLGLSLQSFIYGGRLKLGALILHEDPAHAILESLHLPSDSPAIARARAPDWLDLIPVDAWHERASP